jgi:hypothetical protein
MDVLAGFTGMYSHVPKINLVFAHDTVIGATQFLGHNIENE